MRVRETTSENTYNPVGAKKVLYNVSTGNPVSQPTTPKGNRTVKRIEDVETPGFHALKKCGKFLPLNPVTIRTTSIINKPISLSYIYANNAYGVRGEVGRDIIDPDNTSSWWFKNLIPPPDQSLLDAAELASMANAVGAKWDVLTFLAEFSSTVDTMHHYGRLFNNLVLKGLRGWKGLRRNPYEFLRKEWLAARYGIRPVIYDIESAAQSLERLIGEVNFVKGTGYQSSEVSYVNVTPGSESAIDGYFTQTRTIETKRVYRGAAYLEIDTSILGNVQIDPIVTAYELVPYSFVIDKFINFGAWLSTITPQLQGAFAGNQKSIKTSVTALSVTTGRANNAGQKSYECLPSASSYTIEEYVRIPGTGVAPFPGFNPRITLPFMADLFALFVKGRNDTMKLATRR